MQAYKRFKDRGVVFLGVNINDKAPQGAAFVSRYGIPYPAGHDAENRIAGLFGVDGTPTTFFLDGDHTVLAIARGRMESQRLEAVLANMLPSRQ